MKKSPILLVLSLFLLAGTSAQADKNPSYTFTGKGYTMLQSVADRSVPAQAETGARTAVPGESPVTGLPWEGEYLPMLVQISNSFDTVKVGGRNVKTSGVGKRAPWGAQYADIIYEELMYRAGYTRYAMLFSDCFAQGQPSAGVGPVRSCRIGPLMLREEWQSGLVFSGGFFGAFGWSDQTTPLFISENKVASKGVLFNVLTPPYHPSGYRVKGRKAPDNFSLDIIALRAMIPETTVATPHPFLFSDDANRYARCESAATVSLDWGTPDTISHFVYDEKQNAYQRFCGKDAKPEHWVPFVSTADPADLTGQNQVPLYFSNLIVQRITYAYEDNSALKPVPGSIGKGNADIFLNGRYIPGTWSRPSLGDATVFYDDQGQELRLYRGKTYIVHFPAEALCAYQRGAVTAD